MKIKFAGPQRSDGTWPPLDVDGKETELAADGTIDVSEELGNDLLDTGNFELHEDQSGADTSKDDIVAKAQALGIKATKSWGLAKLEAAIAEAEAAKAAAAAAAPTGDANKPDDFLG